MSSINHSITSHHTPQSITTSYHHYKTLEHPQYHYKSPPPPPPSPPPPYDYKSSPPPSPSPPPPYYYNSPLHDPLLHLPHVTIRHHPRLHHLTTEPPCIICKKREEMKSFSLESFIFEKQIHYYLVLTLIPISRVLKRSRMFTFCEAFAMFRNLLLFLLAMSYATAMNFVQGFQSVL